MNPGDVPSSEALAEEREALELLHSGQLELARHKLMILSKKHPNIAKFHFNAALILYKLRRFDDALDEINAGLWLKPDDVKASAFKKEIIDSRVKVKAAEAAQIVVPSATNAITTVVASIAVASQDIIEEKGAPPPVVSSSASLATSPGALPDVQGSNGSVVVPAIDHEQPRLEPTGELPPLVSTDSPPAAVPGSQTVVVSTRDNEPITSSQPETLPAIQSMPPVPASPSPEPEVMPAVSITSISPGTGSKNEPAIMDAASKTLPGSALEKSMVGEASIPQASPADPQPSPARDQPPASIMEARSLAEPAAAPATIEPSTMPADEPGSSDDIEGEQVADQAIAGPEITASAPGLKIVESGDVAKNTPMIDEILEVEPRIPIHEKAAEITLGPVDTPAIPPESMHEDQVEHPPAPPSTRLTNLKDLFKGSGRMPESHPVPFPDSGCVLSNTITVEPAPCPARKGVSRQPGEDGLISFSSFKELDSYKFSIQALVEKYLMYKAEHEVTGREVDDSAPLILEERSPIEMEEPYKEADLPPHECASTGGTILDAALAPSTLPGIPYSPDVAETLPGEPSATGTDASPPQPATTPDSATPPATLPTGGPTNGHVKNVASTQQPLIDIISATGGQVPHHIEMDITRHVSATVMAKARVGKLVHVKDEYLAHVVDMETYAMTARLNRLIARGKAARMNVLDLKSAGEIIGEIEHGVQPVALYPAKINMQEKVVDIEAEISALSSGGQQGLSDDAIAKFLDYIKKVGEEQAMAVVDDEDAPIRLKAATARIKRVALDLYNNTQYEQAITIYSTYLGYFPEDFEGLFNLGFSYRELGNYKDAEESFKRIIELFYDNAYAWYNLSVIYSITTEGEKEAYCLQRAREFGYAVDINRLSRLMVTFTPKNPFDF